MASMQNKQSQLFLKDSLTKLVFGRIPFFGPPLPFANYDEPLHLANYDEAVPKISTSGRQRLMAGGEFLQHI